MPRRRTTRFGFVRGVRLLVDHSVVRAAMVNDGIGVSDVLQVWLVVSVHPTQGRFAKFGSVKPGISPYSSTDVYWPVETIDSN
jgi:hypothetical protein